MSPHIGFDLIAFQITGFGTGYKDDVIRQGCIDVKMGKRSADDSAAAIAPDCFADLFRGGYSDSKVIIFILEYIGNETGRNTRSASVIDALKIPVTGNSGYFHLTTENFNFTFS